jgi:hypothetical protein
MKKIHLSIPKPCHENWDAMTQNEKGRFCASCQKTVIDFTNMNDRQLADFFKKPPTSLCGHFYQDQLERDIEIPRKRIPWIRYFFQISLPALLFSMKATAQGKVSSRGDTVVLPLRSPETARKNLGISGDSLKKDNHKKPLEKIDKRKAIHVQTKSIDPPNQMEITDQFNKIPEIKRTPIVREECFNQSFSGALGGVVVVGGLRTNRHPKAMAIIKDTTARMKRVVDTVLKKFLVYPNPVQSNSSINISLKKIDAGDYTVSIINLAGEIVQTEEVLIESKMQVMSIRLKDITAGTYLVHFFNRKTAASYSEKIIVQ